MPSPNLGLVTTDLGPADVFDIPATLQPDLLKVDAAAAAGGGGRGNLLMNPGFEINQRGVASWTGDGVYGLDGWYVGADAGESVTLTPDASDTPDGTGQAVRCDFAKLGGDHGKIAQNIEGTAWLRGRTLALSIMVKASQPNAVRAFIQDGVGIATSAYHPGDGAWHQLGVFRLIAATATLVTVGTRVEVDGTHRADNAMLVYGSAPLAYTPPDPGEDQRRCERRYEVHGRSSGFPYIRGYHAGAAGDLAAVGVGWRTKKGGPPTVTKVGTWVANNATQPVVTNANADGYMLRITALAAGDFDALPDSADDAIVGEWNV